MLFPSVFLISKKKFLSFLVALFIILVFQSSTLSAANSSPVSDHSTDVDNSPDSDHSMAVDNSPDSDHSMAVDNSAGADNLYYSNNNKEMDTLTDKTVSPDKVDLDPREIRIKALEDKLASIESLLQEKTEDSQAKPLSKGNVQKSEKAYTRRLYSDKAWEFSIGGRFFYDGISPRGVSESLESQVGEMSSKTELRKGRISVNGHSKENINFKMEFEFAGGDADYTDIYMSMPLAGPTKTHIGRQKEPFGMEQASSSTNLPFMERSLVTRSIMPARSTGITVLNRKKAATGLSWEVGYFRNTNSYGIEDDKSGKNLTGRIMYLPYYVNRGESLLHLGASYSYNHPDNGELQITGKVGSNLLPDFGDTGPMNVEHSSIIGGEIAWQKKSLFLQAEAAKKVVALDTGGHADFSGYYLSAGWFLTGEHRNYSRSYGSFSSVKPEKNFKNWRGGAVQLVTRYHVLDLDDSSAGIFGGKVREFDFGINWFLNNGSRIMMDYMRPTLSGAGTANIMQMRFQVAF